MTAATSTLFFHSDLFLKFYLKLPHSCCYPIYWQLQLFLAISFLQLLQPRQLPL